MLSTPQARVRTELGQVVILFALLIPVILTIGSVVVSAGNWYVLKRHLQTQVDSAALAGGQAFMDCGVEPGIANGNIATAALKYSGDTLRSGTPYNLQLEQSGDQRVVLNSTNYWTGGATDGTGYDNSLGYPCDTKFVDVKATDERAPLLFKWIPLFPDLKSRARVELHELEGGEGIRPIGVPEVDPTSVAVLIINEQAVNAATNPAAIVNPPGQRSLTFQTTPPAGLSGLSVWSNTITPVDLGNGSSAFGTVIVASRDPGFVVNSGSLQSICTQNPTQTKCYSGASATSGISFIHAYPGGGAGTANDPIVRDVTLSGGCGIGVSPPARDANPYFNVDDGTTCSGIGISATIDFGTGAVDPQNPVATGGVCAEVSASPGGTMIYAGGVWTAAFTPAIASGANQIDITTTTDTTGPCTGGNNPSDTFTKVARPYVADDASGPVEYLTLEDTNTGLIANSINKTSVASIKVSVGLTPPLTDAAPSAPPIPLRIWNTPSQSQTLDCASGASGWNTAMEFGCPPYQIYDQAWHTSGCGPPPAGVPVPDPPDCIASKTGNFSQAQINAMWASPCSATLNNWYQNGFGEPPLTDKRWIPLFIVDETAFTISGKKYYPVRRFGGFYVTAGSGMNCPGDDPSGNLDGKRTLYGHFRSYILPTFGEVIPDEDLCTFTDGGVCVPVLVE
jgi:hypothetical protein